MTNEIPSEIKSNILSFLKWKEIKKMESISKSWNEATKDELLWKEKIVKLSIDEKQPINHTTYRADFEFFKKNTKKMISEAANSQNEQMPSSGYYRFLFND